MSVSTCRRRRTLIAAFLAVGCAQSVFGQVSGTWIGPSGGNWSHGPNWTSNPLVPGGGGTATFGRFFGSVVVDANPTLAAIRLDNAYTSLTGAATLTLTGPGLLDTPRAFVWDARHPMDDLLQHRIEARLAGGAGLTKSGPGLLHLTGTSSFTGGVRINGGTLSVASNAALGDPTATITFNGGALRGGANPFNRPIVVQGAGGFLDGGFMNLTGVISGSGGLGVRAGGYTLSAANTFTGPFSAVGNGATLSVSLSGPNGSLATNRINVDGTGFLLDNGAAANANRIADTANVHLRAGRFSLGGNGTISIHETIGTLTLTGGYSEVDAAGTARLIAGTLVRQNRATFDGGNRVSFGNAASFLIGGGGPAGSTTMSIVPFASSSEITPRTHDANGLRGLAPGEYLTTMPTSGVTAHNVRLLSTITINAPVTVNSLSLGDTVLAGRISGTGTITVTSGFIGAYHNSGVGNPIDFGTAEGVLSTNNAVGGTSFSNLHGSNGVTIAGGAVVLGGTSRYTGKTTVNGGLRVSGNLPATGPGPLGADSSPVELVGDRSWISSGSIFARDLIVRSIGYDDPRAAPVLLDAMQLTGDVTLERSLRLGHGVHISGDVTGPGRIVADRVTGQPGPTVTLSGSSTYTGGTQIGYGTFIAGSDEAFGSGSVTIGASHVFINQPNTIGTLRAANGARSLANTFVLTGPAQFAGTDAITITGDIDVSSPVHSVIAAPGTPVTFAGVVRDGRLNVDGGTATVTGTLRLTNAANAQLGNRVARGTLEVSAAAALGDPAHATVVSGGTLALAPGLIVAHPLELAGALRALGGDTHVIGPARVVGSTDFYVDAGTLTIAQLTHGTSFTKLAAGTLVIPSVRNRDFSVRGGTLRFTEGSGTGSVTILGVTETAPNLARLDVADNDVVVDYAGFFSPIAEYRQDLRSGYAGGAWNGPGLVSSVAAATSGMALGYAEASAIFTSFPATFSNLNVDNTSLLIAYTHYGDANLDGQVNLQDFNRLAASFGQTNRFWHHGDFNYDGVVNLQDFNRLATNFGLSAAGPDVTPQDWANLAAAVPEPGVGATVLGLLTLIASRRRRRAVMPAI